MVMHQLGHSRAQIMHEVHAGSISRMEPCAAPVGDPAVMVAAGERAPVAAKSFYRGPRTGVQCLTGVTVKDQ